MLILQSIRWITMHASRINQTWTVSLIFPAVKVKAQTYCSRRSLRGVCLDQSPSSLDSSTQRLFPPPPPPPPNPPWSNLSTKKQRYKMCDSASMFSQFSKLHYSRLQFLISYYEFCICRRATSPHTAVLVASSSPTGQEQAAAIDQLWYKVTPHASFYRTAKIFYQDSVKNTQSITRG